MPGPKSDKVWSDAIRKAVMEYHEEKDESGKVRKVRWINLLARNLRNAAGDGDMAAMKEIGLRLDGQPFGEKSVNVNSNTTVTVEHRGLSELLEALGFDEGREAGESDPPVVLQ